MRWLVVVALAASPTVHSCEGPARIPDIEGVVTEVDVPGTGTGWIRIQAISTYSGDRPYSGGTPSPGAPVDVIVRVTENTKIYRDIGGVLQVIPFREVPVGPRARAKAWFTGPVTASDPVQAWAEAVVVWTLAP